MKEMSVRNGTNSSRSVRPTKRKRADVRMRSGFRRGRIRCGDLHSSHNIFNIYVCVAYCICSDLNAPAYATFIGITKVGGGAGGGVKAI